jgi:hypothetical protein
LTNAPAGYTDAQAAAAALAAVNTNTVFRTNMNLSATQLTGPISASQLPSGVVTNAYYTNGTAVQVIGNVLELGTNNFGGSSSGGVGTNLQVLAVGSMTVSNTLTVSNITASGTFSGNGSGLTGIKVADTNITGTITVTNGNVGIGTTSPGYGLTVNGASWITGTLFLGGIPQVNQAAIDIHQLADNSSGGLRVLNASSITSVRFWADGTSGHMSGGTGDTLPLSINTLGSGAVNIGGGGIIYMNGNVGIGTTSPKNALDVIGSGSFSGTITATNGVASYSSNTLALTSISFPATTVNWTNTLGKSIYVFINNAGVTGTALKINGTQIASTLLVTGDTMIPLQPGEYFSETYSAGTPTAVWKPF